MNRNHWNILGFVLILILGTASIVDIRVFPFCMGYAVGVIVGAKSERPDGK